MAKYNITKLVGRRADTVKTPNGTKYFMFVGKPIMINTDNSAEDPPLLAKRIADIAWFKTQPVKYSVAEEGKKAVPIVTVKKEEAKPIAPKKDTKKSRRAK